MFSVHACAVRSTLVGRACYKRFPRNIVNTSLHGVQARGNVSSASTAETTQSAPDDAVKAGELNHSVIEEENPEKQSTPYTPISYRLVGNKRLEKWKKSMKELRGLQRELSSLYGTKRLRPRHFPSEYGVGRLSLLDRELDSPLITVRENKIFHRDLYIPNLWLRDNCQCGSCVHEATRQRLLDTFSIPKDISIISLQEADGVFAIKWSDGHSSSYSKGFLARAHQTSSVKSIVRNGLDFAQLWDSSIASTPPFVSYEQAMGNHMLYLLRRIRQYGFVYVDETPPRPESTKRLLERISFIRRTHYGGFYDFTSDLASKDTAYTNMALEAHTDTTYFSDPAGLQAFHLLSHTGGEGGASLLVDGFKVAEELRIADPKAYDILATVNVHAHSSGNKGISIQPYRGFPVLEHDRATGELLRVRWNSSDRASIELPLSEVETWYDAARKFDALLKKKENEYWAQLRPGTVLIFDNWRVLHGRSAFTGERRICGAYLNRDDWISKYKMLQMREQEVLDALPFS